MPKDLTIFAASYLVYIDVALAAVILIYLLTTRSGRSIYQWLVAALCTLVLGYLFSKIAGDLYRDPRPFTIDHVRPLIHHAADNGFPSDHALLAAAVVALVLLLDWRWALPFVVLAVLVDWARVGAGLHHVQDVAGSGLIVAVALLIGVATAWLVSPFVQRTVERMRQGDRPAGVSS